MLFSLIEKLSYYQFENLIDFKFDEISSIDMTKVKNTLIRSHDILGKKIIHIQQDPDLEMIGGDSLELKRAHLVKNRRFIFELMVITSVHK